MLKKKAAEQIVPEESAADEPADEEGTAEEVFANPAHPYTQALLTAAPAPIYGYRQARLRLSGEIPSAMVEAAYPWSPNGVLRYAAIHEPEGKHRIVLRGQFRSPSRTLHTSQTFT